MSSPSLADVLESQQAQDGCLSYPVPENWMQGRTTFVIAHRLSTVRAADLILVLQEGEIVEQGSHHDLMAQGGIYREIYTLQLGPQGERLREVT